jgi:hypothetical protein
MFHGLPSCDFLVPTLYGKLSNPSAILLEIGHARENIDKFTTKGRGESRLSRRERSIFGWFSRSSSEIRTFFFKVD